MTVVFTLSLAKCSNPGSEEKVTNDHNMALLLKHIANSANFQENEYLNTERSQELRKDVNNLLNTENSIESEIDMRLALGTELLRAGMTEKAIDEFQNIWLSLDNVRDPRSRKLSRRILLDMLGLSFLRLGEQQNCLLTHTSDACILPISGDGLHVRPTGSQNAIKYFSALLEKYPDDLGAVWLINIAYMTLGKYPMNVPDKWLIPPHVFSSSFGISPFPDVAPASGLATVGLSGGSIMEDFNGDGFLDIAASSWGLRDQLRYFRSNGDGTFSDHTKEAGLIGQVGGLNLAHADYDNDGDRDLLVLRGSWLDEAGLHPNTLLQNNGRGQFADATQTSGLLSFHPTHSASWADYDSDGWLDLYVGNESNFDTFGAAPNKPHPSQLYHSNGNGTFTDIAEPAGVDVIGYVKGVAWGDYDNDGSPDLYLSILHSDNVLFHNNISTDSPHSTSDFTDVTTAAGVAEPTASFPTWFWDFDNDGWVDIFVGSFEFEGAADILDMYFDNPSIIDRPRLYRNRGDGSFADVTEESGLHRIIAAMGANFGDLDNDGFLDCYIGTGHPQMRALMPNRMFRNAGNGRFQDVTSSARVGHLQKGHGVSFGDIDNDGDQDLFHVIGGAYSGDVYQNALFENPGHGNHWIVLQLQGVRSNRDGIGAVIIAHVTENGNQRQIFNTVGSGGSFGASSLQQEIGLGKANVIERLEIIWPSGEHQSFSQIKTDQFIAIKEGDDKVKTIKRRSFLLGDGVSVDHHH